MVALHTIMYWTQVDEPVFYEFVRQNLEGGYMERREFHFGDRFNPSRRIVRKSYIETPRRKDLNIVDLFGGIYYATHVPSGETIAFSVAGSMTFKMSVDLRKKLGGRVRD